MRSATLVGRDRERRALEALLETVGRGRPAAVAITGEPGIGKSRLLAELAAEGDERRLLVLEARADPFGGDVPLGVFVDALDDYLASIPQSRLGQLDEHALAELGTAFPSLAGAGRPAEGELDRRQRLHRAVRALLRALAVDRPLVLALDDLHWADPATVDLVAFLLRRLPDAPVLLAVALRPRAAPTRLAGALAGADAAGTLTTLALEPLGADGIDALAGPGLDAATRHVLHRDSGGNPFYVEQLLRAARRAVVRGDEPVAPAAGEDVPAPVAAAIAQELMALPEAERTLLEAAAVVGEPFEPDVAAETAGLDESSALAALDVLLASELVRPTDVPRRFRFRHPIVRRAVYDAAPAGWRLAAHARVAAAFERRGLPAAARAVHVERAAHVGDEAAVAVLTEAATASAPRAPASAAHWFAAALRLLPGAAPERRLGLLVPLAQSLAAAGRLDEAQDALREVLDLLPQDLALERARLVAACAKLEHLVGRHGAGRALLEEALAKLPDGESPEAAALKVELTSDCFFTGDFEGMLAWAEEALAAARAVGDAALRGAAGGLLAAALYMVGDVDRARTMLDESAVIVDGLSDDELVANLSALAWFGWTEVFLERFDAALGHLGRGAAIAAATGQAHMLVLARIGRANVMLATGRLDEAAELAEGAADAAELASPGPLLGWALAVRCWAELLRGDLDEAERHGERAMSQVADTHDVVSILAACFLAEVRLEAGKHERARDELLAAAGGPDLPPIERAFQPRWYEVLARAELGLGRADEAAAWARRARTAAEGMRLGGPTAAARRAEAAVALRDGDAAGAAALAAQGAEAADAAGMPIEAARCRTLAGAALAAAGEREPALAELTAAETELAGCGAVRLRDDARREMRRLGRRRPAGTSARPTEAGGLGALSARESEVAALIAAGDTNRQIAERLVISERTVESHVANIFTKLRVGSRAGVASAVAGAQRAER